MVVLLSLKTGLKALNKTVVQPRLAIRQVHKGPMGAPPMRWTSVSERMGWYLFMCVTFLSYPTYVLYNLDRFRPKPENELSPETQQALEEHRAARLANFQK